MLSKYIKQFIDAVKHRPEKPPERFTARQIKAAIMQFINSQFPDEEDGYKRILECKKAAPNIRLSMQEDEVRAMINYTQLLANEEIDIAETVIQDMRNNHSQPSERTYALLFEQYAGRDTPHLAPQEQ